MFTLFSFTSAQVLLAVGGLAAAIVLIIVAARFAMRRNSQNLTEKYKDKEWSSPLESRTKYPDVDILRHSSTLTLTGLAASLFLLLVLMSWTTYEQVIDIPDFEIAVETDVIVEPPRTAEPPPPPPPPPPPVIQEVPDELILEEEEVTFLDQSIDAEAVIDIPEEVVSDVSTEDVPPPPPPPPVEVEDEIFKVVEEMPRFPGCEDMGGTIQERTQCANQKLYQFIYKYIQYPILARENNIQGNVVLSFVVNKDGSIVDLKVLRDPGAGCAEEAMRVIEMINEQNIKWTPGKQRGKPVRVQFILPIKFALA